MAANNARAARRPIIALTFSECPRGAPPSWADVLIVEGDGALAMLKSTQKYDRVVPLAPCIDPRIWGLSPWPRVAKKDLLIFAEKPLSRELDLLLKQPGFTCSSRIIPEATDLQTQKLLRGAKHFVATFVPRQSFRTDWSFLSRILEITASGGAVIAPDIPKNYLEGVEEVVAAANTPVEVAQQYGRLRNENYREGVTVKARRIVFDKHTHECRAQTVLEAIGIDVSPTRRNLCAFMHKAA